MLTSAAAIAGALTALLGLYYSVVAAVKKNSAAKMATNIQAANVQIKAATTDAERQVAQDALNKLINP